MAYRQIDRTLREEVFNAVRTAASSGSNQSKASIAARFEGRGVSRSSLYGWITKDMEDIAQGLVFQIDPPEPGKPIASGVEGMAERGAVALAAGSGSAIHYQKRLHESLMRSDVIRAMGYGPDGKPKNVRLIMDADESERKKLQTAAIIQEKIAASQREIHSQFMDELLDIVMAELPHIRDKILQRMDAVRQKYGEQR